MEFKKFNLYAHFFLFPFLEVPTRHLQIMCHVYFLLNKFLYWGELRNFLGPTAHIKRGDGMGGGLGNFANPTAFLLSQISYIFILFTFLFLAYLIILFLHIFLNFLYISSYFPFISSYFFISLHLHISFRLFHNFLFS